MTSKRNSNLNFEQNSHQISNGENQDLNFKTNPNFNYNSFKEQAIKSLYQGREFTGKDGIFGGMIKDILETALGEELNQHLSWEGKNLGSGFDNRRNGYNTILTSKHPLYASSFWSKV